MIDNDARRTDLHAYMQHTVPPDPRPTPTTRCPRCARDIDAYRANNLGQVGQPSRKRQRMLNKVAEARARKVPDAGETTTATETGGEAQEPEGDQP